MVQISKPFCDPAFDGNKAQLGVRGINLHTLEIDNSESDDFWLQLFDKNDIADVTLGTTVPDQTYLIPAGDGTLYGQLEKEFSVPLVFGNGLVYAVTTTPDGATVPAASFVLNIGYRQPRIGD